MKVWTALVVQFCRQVAIARNLRECVWMRVRRSFWAAFYLHKAFRVAFRAMFHEQLGSRVVFDGMRCSVSNWARSAYPTLSGPDFYKENVPREQIRNVVDASELLHRFRFGFSFYMNSWHCLDVAKRLYPDCFPTAGSPE